MCKLMKCRIILAWGKCTVICSMCSRVVLCVWVTGDQNLTSQNLLRLNGTTLCVHVCVYNKLLLEA